jgi:hypothetical protein
MPLQVFSTQSKPIRGYRFEGERLVNLYAEAGSAQALSSLALVGTPGLIPWITLPTFPTRGMIYSADRLFIVSGDKVYTVNSAGVFVQIGTIPLDGSQLVTMATNGDQVAIASGGIGYIASTTGLNQISDPDFPSVSSVAFFGGYFIWTIQATGEIIISKPYDGTDYDALDFATAENGPDNLVACYADDRSIQLFGTNSLEFWTFGGNPDFPFEPITGATATIGCFAKNSICKGIETTYWLGASENSGPGVYMLSGYQPVKISHPGLDAIIESAPRANQSRSFFYAQEGHEFYVLQIPDVGCWVYDRTTALWHERTTRLQSGLQISWRAEGHKFVWGKHIVGDWVNGRLFQMSFQALTDDGVPIAIEAVCSTIANGDQRQRMHRLFVDIDSGVGESYGIGYDPIMLLDYSNDAGKTWQGSLAANMGKQGEYQTRAVWWRLGQFRGRKLRLRTDYPVRKMIVGADARLEGDQP